MHFIVNRNRRGCERRSVETWTQQETNSGCMAIPAPPKIYEEASTECRTDLDPRQRRYSYRNFAVSPCGLRWDKHTAFQYCDKQDTLGYRSAKKHPRRGSRGRFPVIQGKMCRACSSEPAKAAGRLDRLNGLAARFGFGVACKPLSWRC